MAEVQIAPIPRQIETQPISSPINPSSFGNTESALHTLGTTISEAANKMIEAFCQQDERLVYIDVFRPMLGTDGQPRSELFLEDRLHMNAAGYALWTELIKPRLKE